MTPDSRLSELLIRWEDSKENDSCFSLEHLCAGLSRVARGTQASGRRTDRT